jgi:hypothetical protein
VHPAPPAASGHQAEGEKQGQYGQQVTFHGAKIRLSESKSKEKSEKLFSSLCRAEVSKAKPEIRFSESKSKEKSEKLFIALPSGSI